MENNIENNGQPVAEGQEQQQNKRKSTWKRVGKAALWVVVAAGIVAAALRLYDAMQWCYYEQVSEDVVVQTRDWPDEYRIVNTKTGHVTQKHVTFVSCIDEESRLVRFHGGKGGDHVGYFDRTTGEAVIAPVYDKGWMSFDGRVAVVDYENMIHFFTSDGKPLHTKPFRYYDRMEEVRYYGSHCAISDSAGRWGLIDTAGRWTFEPQYTAIEAEVDDCEDEWLGVWHLRSAEGEAIANDEGRIILVADAGSGVSVDDDGTIVVNHNDSPAEVYDLTGRLLYRKAYYTVRPIYVDGEDEYSGQERAHALEYMLWNERHGLMDLGGHPLTKAEYSNIEALGADLFRACIYGSTAEVVLDARGRIVE